MPSADKKVKDLTTSGPRERPLGDVMREAHRCLVVHLERALHEAGYDDVGAAHVSVLATVDREGTRLADLVERGGRTKQATAELGAHLTGRRYLELRPDPTDGRAKLYFLTAAGRSLLEACRTVVVDYEDWLASILGTDGIARLRLALVTIIQRAAEDGHR